LQVTLSTAQQVVTSPWVQRQVWSKCLVIIGYIGFYRREH
jgi:hypothetical protein